MLFGVRRTAPPQTIEFIGRYTPPCKIGRRQISHHKLLKFIFDPKKSDKVIFILNGDVYYTHSFIHEFFSDPIICSAANRSLSLLSINSYPIFFKKNSIKPISLSAVKRALTRSKEIPWEIQELFSILKGGL